MKAVSPVSAGIPGAQSIRRAIRILRLLAAGQDQGVRLTDIVEESGLNRPTVHRILRVLVDEGAVEQDPVSRRYLIGPEISLLGIARVSRFPIKSIAEPYLQYLAEHAGDTAFVTIRSGFDSICVDRKTGTYPVKVLSIEVGARRPLGVGVAGVVILASLTEAETASIVEANAQRLAHHHLTVAKLTERVRIARSRGYAYSESGVVRGTRAIAVPVLGQSGEASAAISIAAISDRLSIGRLPSLVTLMTRQATLISRRLVEVAQARKLTRRT